jgi:hypothetical protein
MDRPRLAGVGEDVRVGASPFLKGVGQDREPLRLKSPGRRGKDGLASLEVPG